MSTYPHTIGIQWGTDGAPTAVRVIDATGTVSTPTLTTAIAEAPAGSGFYVAVATYDEAWGVPVKDVWGDGGAEWYAGDMAGPADVRFVRSVAASLKPNAQTGGPIAKDSTDPVNLVMGASGLTPSSLQIKLPGAGYVTAQGTFTSRGSKTYDYAPHASETAATGSVTLLVVATTGEEASVTFGVTDAASGGGGGTGSGDTPVDHDGAAGVSVDGVAAAADCMRYAHAGAGIDGVEIVAYLAADYDAGLRGTGNRRGTTETGSDGRWVVPLMLDAGTYRIVASKPGYVVDSYLVAVP